jgi:chemotaxis protein MotA
MDISSIIGLVGGFGMVMLSVAISGMPFSAIWNTPSFAEVVVGSYGTLFLYCTIPETLSVLTIMGSAFRKVDFHQTDLITKLMAMSEKARREGLLSLEDQLEDVDDEFLKKGMRMVVDGTDATVIEDLLSNEISQMNGRHNRRIAAINMWATLGPGLGMLGTVQGLIGMLRNLEDKAALGPNMAVALVTTFYGSILANLVLIPIGGKLQNRDGDETQVKEMEIEGILSIQAGDNPHILAQKMLSYLDPKTRKTVESQILKD